MNPLTLVIQDAVLYLGLAASLLLVSLSLYAYLRRRTVSYMLLSLAFLTVLTRVLTGIFALQRWIDPNIHHIVEHVLDICLVALVLSAVYHARNIESSVKEDSIHE